MNFNNPGMTSYADSGSAGGTLVPQRKGMFSFLRGKLSNWADKTAQAKYGEAYGSETDPSKRRQMMAGAIGEGLQSLGGQEAPEPPPLLAPGSISGGSSLADILQMMRARRQQPQQMGRMGVRGLFG